MAGRGLSTGSRDGQQPGNAAGEAPCRSCYHSIVQPVSPTCISRMLKLSARVSFMAPTRACWPPEMQCYGIYCAMANVLSLPTAPATPKVI